MQKLIFIFVLFFAVLISGCEFSENNKNLSDKLFFLVEGKSREFFFTNKSYSQYYGETNSIYKNGWQGWTFKEKRIFYDYEIFVDGKALDREKASTRVYPYKLERYYDRFKETFVFADSLEYMGLKVEGDRFKFVDLQLYGDFNEKNIKIENKKAVIELADVLKDNKIEIASNLQPLKISKEEKIVRIRFGKGSKAIFNIAVVKGENNIGYGENYIDKIIAIKKKRIENLLEKSFVKTNDSKFDKALAWAKISLDALIARQDYKGIYAGLPWFNNFWGRDLFISLPGATYVQNNFKDAKEIILSFAKAQDTIEESKFYGRIPNRITIEDRIYNTADGTPRFVVQAYQYFMYTGDTAFLKAIYPYIKRAFYGSVKNWVDENGFLTCEDADTWMDAVGPKGPWTPRGSIANDIQALWYEQAISSSKIAELFNDIDFAEKCRKAAEKVKNSFAMKFIDYENFLIYDRISPEGVKDKSIRPNLFFVLNSENFIEDIEFKKKILKNSIEKLVLPYGVMSIAQDDPKFLAYHNFPPYYPKDAAYHNGIIWQWLSGPVVKSLNSFYVSDNAWVLTKSLTDEILYKGALGCLAELKNALPLKRENEPRLSGTYVQAWSLAEYIRSFYQDYLGLSIDASKRILYFIPSLPKEISSVSFIQNIGEENKVEIDFQKLDNIIKARFKVLECLGEIVVASAIRTDNNVEAQFKKTLKENDEYIVVIPAILIDEKDCISYLNGAKTIDKFYLSKESKEEIEFRKSLKFAEPIEIDSFLSKLKADYVLLKNEEVIVWNNNARILIEAEDKLSDEKYLYPLNYNFKNGILDLKKFLLLEDDSRYYFELRFSNLIDPGWHKEYGFQLTFSAIAIRTEDSKRYSKDVDYNSKYIFAKEREFSRLIIVGGGIEILNEENKIIAAYYPIEEDFKNPLGNVANKRIRFAIPKDLLGKINSYSRITILVGAQDDGGGAGIGVFREVDFEPTEWKGGGKKNKNDDNIYDILLIN